MILLEPGNRILGETVRSQLVWAYDEEVDRAEQKRVPCEVSLYDFDDVAYHVEVNPDVSNDMRVSMSIPCWDTIADLGATAALEKHFPGQLSSDVHQGHSFTLAIDLDAYEDEKKSTAMADSLERLKDIVLGSIFLRYLQPVLDGATLPDKSQFALRADTDIYFTPYNDRVIITFGIDFSEHFDKVLARLFVQEFVDARKQLRAAPSCMFGVEPPNELTQAHGEISENKRAGLGYLTVIVTKDHLIRDRLETVVNMLTTLRTYLLYHIKCAKSYLHSRMRSKCAELLKVLNRAKVEEPAEDKKKK